MRQIDLPVRHDRRRIRENANRPLMVDQSPNGGRVARAPFSLH